jgi:outer membrane murein-binding lipoprotein Lpp
MGQNVTLLDHNALETVMAGCVNAAHPNYLRTAAVTLAAEHHITLPEVP